MKKAHAENQITEYAMVETPQNAEEIGSAPVAKQSTVVVAA